MNDGNEIVAAREGLGEGLSDDFRQQWRGLDSLSRVARMSSSVPWAEAVARSDGIAPTFVTLSASGRLRAGAVGDLVPPGAPERYDVEALLADGTEWTPAETLPPSLTLTTRSGGSCDLRVHADENPQHVLTTFFKHLVDWAQDQGAKSTALLLAPDTPEVLEAARDSGFRGVPVDEHYYLDLTFETFDDYLTGLGSSRRKSIRAERRKLKDAQRFSFSAVSLAEGIDLYAHYSAVNLVKHGMDDEGLVGRMRKRAEDLVTSFGEDARLLVMCRDDEPVGMLFMIEDDGILYAKLAGHDADLPRSIPPYFQLGFYELIPYALARGRRRIVYGSSFGGPKRSRGCVAERQWLWGHEPAPDVECRLDALRLRAGT